MFNRISVIGTSGSGKSTLAREIAKISGHERLELDRAYWRANWTGASDEELASIVGEFVKKDRWVIDGNYSRVQSRIHDRADLIISTELSFLLNLWRVTMRSVRRAITREELWAGNRESFVRMFTKDSIIVWMWNTWAGRREKTAKLFDVLEIEEHPTVKAVPIRLGSTRERKIFLHSLEKYGGVLCKALIYPVAVVGGTESILVFKHPISGNVEPVRGTVDPGESARETAIREIEEETGFALSPGEKRNLRRFGVRGRVVPSGPTLDGPDEYRVEEVFTVRVDSSRMPLRWKHRVTGSGIDSAMEFEVFWLPLDQAEAELTELTAEFVPKLRAYLSDRNVV